MRASTLSSANRLRHTSTHHRFFRICERWRENPLHARERALAFRVADRDRDIGAFSICVNNCCDPSTLWELRQSSVTGGATQEIHITTAASCLDTLAVDNKTDCIRQPECCASKELLYPDV